MCPWNFPVAWPEVSIIIPHKAVTGWHKGMAAYFNSIDTYDHNLAVGVF